MAKGLKNIIINWFIVFIAILFVCCLAEIAFRYFFDTKMKLSAETIWEVQSYAKSTKEMDFIEFGGIKFREDKVPDDILEKKWIRILFLGDSFTFGAGIKNNESRFSDIIENRINESLYDNHEQYRVHIFNASEGGSNPLSWYTTFEIIEPLYQPHHVYAIFFLRDGTSLVTSLKGNAEIIDPIQQKYSRMPLYDHSALLRHFYDKFAWAEYTNIYKQKLSSSYLGTDKERSMWKLQQKYLLKLSRSCMINGISFHLVIFPVLFDLKNYQFHDVENELIQFAQDNDISVFSLTPGFLGKDDSSLWVASNDQHPNKEGHRIAATTLLPFIRNNVLRK